MKGLLITSRPRYNDYSYFGFDAAAGTGTWQGIDEWNTIHPVKNIDVKHCLSDLKNLSIVKEFFSFLRKKETDQVVNLLYINDEVDDADSLANFIFLGYDCGYLLDNYEPVFFSSIYNELLREIVNPMLLTFKLNVNLYGLFKNLNDAKMYKKVRDEAIHLLHDEYIETAFDNFSIVKIFSVVDLISVEIQ